MINELNKSDYRILQAIIEHKCFTELTALTTRQLINLTGLSLSRVRLGIKRLLDLKYINEGFKDKSEKTYYITDLGKKNVLKQVGKLEE